MIVGTKWNWSKWIQKIKKALFAKYDELMPKYPGKYLMTYNYAVELFNYTYAGIQNPQTIRRCKRKLKVF
jgi:hypothetical protein